MAYSYLDKAWADAFWKKVKKYVQDHGGGVTPSDLGDLAYKDSASGSFTPSGNVSAPTVTLTPSTENVKSMSAAGTLPSLTASLDDECLILTFGAGSLPTSEDKTVLTGVSAAASAPTFTGTAGTVTVS